MFLPAACGRQAGNFRTSFVSYICESNSAKLFQKFESILIPQQIKTTQTQNSSTTTFARRAPQFAGLCERTPLPENSRFALLNSAGELKYPQTPKENKFSTGHAFEIILPNLIHKSKKRNLT
jgi:hypothetical protein